MAKNDWAIVVGIWRYHPSLGKLEGPKNDAQDFFAWLKDPGGGDVPEVQIKKILSPAGDMPRSPADAEPNEVTVNKEIVKVLEELPKENGVKKGGRLYVYVAGHGTEMREPGGQDTKVLLTANAFGTEYNHSSIPNILRACVVAPGHFAEVVLFMDCCATPAKVSADPPKCDPFLPPGGSNASFVFMHAAKSTRKARATEIGGKMRGVFTQALLMGLRGGASDEHGVITAHALFDYVRSNMRKLLRPEMRESDDPETSQIPELKEESRLLVANAPRTKFKVEVHVGKADVGKELRVLGGSLDVVSRRIAEAEVVEERLPAGLYMVEIVEGAGRRSEVFELPGFSETGDAKVALNEAYRTVQVGDHLGVTKKDPPKLELIDASYKPYITLSRERDHTLTRPGLFKIQAFIGNQIRESYLVVRPRVVAPRVMGIFSTIERPSARRQPPEGPYVVSAMASASRAPGFEYTFGTVELTIPSPAPLAATNAPPSYRTHAARESRTPTVKIGRGSSLFVCVRDTLTAKPNPAKPVPHPAAGLHLRDIEGRSLVDFERASKRGPEGKAAWTTCTVELDPGVYRLSVETPVGTLSQAVIATRGLQTQIFQFLRDYGDAPDSRRADLQGAAIFLGQADFRPGRSDLRKTELVRVALRERGGTVDAAALQDLLTQSRAEPMLQIMGAHLLLSLGDPTEDDRALLARVLRRLRRKLGAHPDVKALALRVEGATGRPRLSVPPMLLESWLAIREASLKQPALIPAESLLAQVEGHVWGFGPVLVWQEVPRARRRHTRKRAAEPS
ncbi:caspase family protein [Polyangium sp. 15x6]|uniref:caspase family protein n=1 Tax=Polyangium sp. 15x6 TaxID=3042687 RepID=UPI00249ADF52|nr:caspase family protein [Polyangium sp. 15x6]MDI3287225.1 caspase family protein [Polyangium sp. 15x6]